VSKLAEQLMIDEGLRLMPYKDTVGKLTIGVGRNIADIGITKEEAMFLLKNDIARVDAKVDKHLPWVKEMVQARQDVVLNMAFNLGISRLLLFKNTLAYMKAGDYDAAAQGMLESKWAKQVGARATRLAQMMKTGEYL
jgi:lysozyme